MWHYGHLLPCLTIWVNYNIKSCYNSLEMSDRVRKNPECSMCSYCCRAPIVLTITPADYRRWKRQGRSDILRYVSVSTEQSYGTLWIDMEDGEEPSYCPFLNKVSDDKCICTIQDTKPKVCKEFRCEWSYGVGKKGIPFKTERGWTDRARRLGYV